MVPVVDNWQSNTVREKCRSCVHVCYNLFIKGYSIWQEPAHLVLELCSYVVPGLRYEDRYN